MVAREFRLRRAIDFENVRSSGRSWSNRLLVLAASPNSLDHNRYGFATGRRIGPIAARNRVKRQIREVIRELHPALQPGFDMIWIARNQTRGGTTIEELELAARHLLMSSGLLLEVAQNRPDSSNNVPSETG